MRRRFTLIELLVVVAVISILAAMLLPALSQARLQALRVKSGNHLRQMTIGLLMYADDQDGTLPQGLVPNLPLGGGSYTNNWAYYRNDAWFNFFNLYPIAVDYGFLPATAHAIMNTATWKQPGAESWLESPSYYFPGFYATAVPIHLNQAKPEHLIWSDYGLTRTNLYYAVHVKNTGQLYDGGPTDPSAKVYIVNDRSQMYGAHGTYFDARLEWTRQSELIETGIRPAEPGLRIVHPPTPVP